MESSEHHIRVPRTARYRVLGDAEGAGELWFVLHGYRQLAERFIRRFHSLPGVASGARAVVAPEGLSRFYIEDGAGGGEHGPDSRIGATWMTRADREHEIRDYVEYLDRLAVAVLDPAGRGPEAAAAETIDGDGRRLVVLGFSQGAATASRWATYGRIRPAELVLWAGGLAADLDTARAAEALAGTRVRMVAGRDDGWATGRVAESRRRLAGVGVETDVLEFEGGHAIPAGVLAEHWP
ncbi:MAG: alpha/beta hydrolase [Candidatus Longimicrobiales bacterium M2_2A_002]